MYSHKSVTKMNPIRTAIILAAGMGTRLHPLTHEIPKCLVSVNGTEILRATLVNLSRSGIKEAVIVVGYKGEKIRQTFGSEFLGMDIIYIENKDYATTNNMYSLWIARKYLEEGTLLIEGDVIFDPIILQRALEIDDINSYWILDQFQEGMDGSMSIADDSGRIIETRIIRDKLPFYLPTYFKSVGILKITPAYGKLFSRWLEEEVVKNNLHIYYDLVLSQHLLDYPLLVCNIAGLKWAEIDNPEDLKKAEKYFQVI